MKALFPEDRREPGYKWQKHQCTLGHSANHSSSICQTLVEQLRTFSTQGNELANDSSTQYVLLVLVKRNDIPSQAQEPQCLLNPYVILSFVGKQTSTVLGVCPCEAVCSVLQRCGSAIPCHELPWDLALRDCAISTSTAPTRPGCFKSLTFLLELQLFTSSASSLSLTSQRFSR